MLYPGELEAAELYGPTVPMALTWRLFRAARLAWKVWDIRGLDDFAPRSLRMAWWIGWHVWGNARVPR